MLIFKLADKLEGNEVRNRKSRSLPKYIPLYILRNYISRKQGQLVDEGLQGLEVFTNGGWKKRGGDKIKFAAFTFSQTN